MENKISLEKVKLILDLLQNLSKENWETIKKYIDDNFETIMEMNESQEKANNISTQIKKELLQLKNKIS